MFQDMQLYYPVVGGMTFFILDREPTYQQPTLYYTLCTEHCTGLPLSGAMFRQAAILYFVIQGVP